MRRSLLLSLLVLPMLVLGGLTQGTQQIVGRVIDPSGAVLPGVTVDLRGEPGVQRTTVTDGNGEFRFAQLPAGRYILTFSLQGFSQLSREVLAVPGQAASVNVVFGVMGLTEPMDKKHVKIPVFFATDRNRIEGRALTYGTRREPHGRLHLGRFTVSVPRDEHHRLGNIERPSIWTFWREDPEKHFIIVKREQLEYERFYSELRTYISSSEAKQAFVFVHGFNVLFEDAVYRTAQLSYDLGFDGAPILYSWPSVGRTLDYRIDERNNEWTVEHLRGFLEDVRAKTGAGMIHLIAHSMGNRALTAALAQMSPRQSTSRFSQLVLTAPDIDSGIFPTLAARFRRMVDRATIYASEADIALKAAARYDTFPRVGSTHPEVVVLDGFDTIDASMVDTSLLGHSYYADSTKVLSDLFYLLRGVEAAGRAILKPVGSPPRSHWAFRQ